MLVGAIYGLVHAAYRSGRRTHVAGNRVADVPAFNEETARLQSAALRARLRASLAHALHDAEHWDQLLVASRPPWGVRRLRAAAPRPRLDLVAQHGECDGSGKSSTVLYDADAHEIGLRGRD